VSDLKKWLVVAAVPALSFIVGAVALPRPKAVAEEKDDVDRESLGSAVRTTKPTPNSSVDVLLGDQIRVLGADVPKEPVKRGEKLSVTFYFGCESELDADWQVFVHVDAKPGAFRIHGDHFPVRGKYPTTLWKENEFIADTWSTTVPRDAVPGTYEVWTGFYVGDDRLPMTDGNRAATDGQNRVRVGMITVSE
jgi:hypothetical protein